MSAAFEHLPATLANRASLGSLVRDRNVGSLNNCAAGHTEGSSVSSPRWPKTTSNTGFFRWTILSLDTCLQAKYTQLTLVSKSSTPTVFKCLGLDIPQARLHELKEQKKARTTSQQSELHEVSGGQSQEQVGNGNHLTKMTRGKRSMGRTHPRVFAGPKENGGAFEDVVLSPNGARLAANGETQYIHEAGQQAEVLSHVTCTDAAEALVTMKLA